MRHFGKWILLVFLMHACASGRVEAPPLTGSSGILETSPLADSSEIHELFPPACVRENVETAPGVQENAMWYESLLGQDTNQFHSDLARLSLSLSTAAYSHGMEQANVPLYDAFQELGFESGNISLYGYPGHSNNRTDLPWAKEDAYSLGVGHRRCGDETLLLVVLRGTGPSTPYTRSLTDPGLSSVPFLNVQAHNRFFAFYELAAEGVKNHISRHSELGCAAEEGTLSILITGHSLGGAAANLLGAAISNPETGEEFFPEGSGKAANRLFVYTFACPRTFHSGGETAPATGDCANIFNVIIARDPVTALPRDNRLSLGETWMRFGPAVIVEPPDHSARAGEADGDLSLHSTGSYQEALLSQESVTVSMMQYFSACVSK